MVSVVQKMREYTGLPLIAKPNAGLPQLEDGETVKWQRTNRFNLFASHGQVSGNKYLSNSIFLLDGIFRKQTV